MHSSAGQAHSRFPPRVLRYCGSLGRYRGLVIHWSRGAYCRRRIILGSLVPGGYLNLTVRMNHIVSETGEMQGFFPKDITLLEIVRSPSLPELLPNGDLPAVLSENDYIGPLESHKGVRRGSGPVYLLTGGRGPARWLSGWSAGGVFGVGNEGTGEGEGLPRGELHWRTPDRGVAQYWRRCL